MIDLKQIKEMLWCSVMFRSFGYKYDVGVGGGINAGTALVGCDHDSRSAGKDP
jgi:hypothetical protein